MRIICLFAFSLMLWPASLWAGDENTGLIQIFEKTCRELEIPQDVTMAIAQVESGFNPWALNIEGRGYQFDSREDALAKAREAQNSGQSYDVGVMQVNNWWFSRFDVSLDEAFEPEANIFLGGSILKSEIERHSSLKAAVGAYHSPKKARAGRYSDKVMAAALRGYKPSNNLASVKRFKQSLSPSEVLPGPMTVISRTAAFVSPQNMKAASANHKSMKVSFRR